MRKRGALCTDEFFYATGGPNPEPIGVMLAALCASAAYAPYSGALDGTYSVVDGATAGAIAAHVRTRLLRALRGP